MTRRLITATAASLASLSVLGGLCVVAAAGEAKEPPNLATRKDGSDWETFLGPGANSRTDETGLLLTWPASGPPLAWAIEVGEGYTAPAVSRGRLFHFDRVDNEARLSCLSAETGATLWRTSYSTDYEDYYDYSNGPRSSPVVDGDRVYTLGVEGRLRCQRVTDGELLWDVDTSRQFGVVQNFFGVGSNPVIHGDLLIAMIGGSPAGSPKIHSGSVRGNGSGIVAFDKHTGKVVYQLSDELASYSTPVLTRIGGRVWGFAFTRGGLIGFDPDAGTQDFFFPWRAKVLESVNASTPVVVGDTVFISETYGPGSALIRAEPGGYEVIWRDPPRRGQALQTHWNTPVFHDGYLYASSGRNTGNAELRCVRHDSGEVVWSREDLGRATLLYADGHFVVLSESGELRLIRASPESYQEVAFADLAAQPMPGASPASSASRPLVRAPAWNAPVIANGLLYVRGKDTLAAFELIPRSAR
ncbi:MAG: PQQ-binding-like beta-propeller repeat protein [Thermoanaerobaculia bacterium]